MKPSAIMTLSYRSLARLSDAAHDLKQILVVSRAKNAAMNMTGILIYDGVHFLQTLEGPVDEIGALFHRIMDDPRHIEVVPFDVKLIERRRFADWDMHLFDKQDAAMLVPDLAVTDFSDFWLNCVHDRAATVLVDRAIVEPRRISLPLI